MKMNMGGMACQRRIAGDDGIDDQQVLRRCGTQSQRISPGEPTNPGQVGAYGAQGTDEKGVLDGSVDSVFELVYQHVVTMHADVALLQKLRRGKKSIAQLQERRGITPSRGQANGLHLERLSQLVQLGDAVNGDVGHFEAAPPTAGNEAVGDQSGHRFPQRGAGHADALRLFHFEQGGARGEESVENLPAQLTVRPLTGAERYV